MIQSICVCKCGAARRINQDRAGQFLAKDISLFFVADGMGGHYAGEKASEAVLRALRTWWDTRTGTVTTASFLPAVEQLCGVIEACGGEIKRAVPPGVICGTTLVLLLLCGDCYAILSVGDSRCYNVTPGWVTAKMEQMTIDDVVQGDGPNRGKLCHAIGAGKDCPVMVRTGRIAKKSLFVLCSDGIYKYCDQKVFATALSRAARDGKLQKAAETIEANIVEGGSPDNYSLVLVRP